MKEWRYCCCWYSCCSPARSPALWLQDWLLWRNSCVFAVLPDTGLWSYRATNSLVKPQKCIWSFRRMFPRVLFPLHSAMLKYVSPACPHVHIVNWYSGHSVFVCSVIPVSYDVTGPARLSVSICVLWPSCWSAYGWCHGVCLPAYLCSRAAVNSLCAVCALVLTVNCFLVVTELIFLLAHATWRLHATDLDTGDMWILMLSTRPVMVVAGPSAAAAGVLGRGLNCCLAHDPFPCDVGCNI